MLKTQVLALPAAANGVGVADGCNGGDGPERGRAQSVTSFLSTGAEERRRQQKVTTGGPSGRGHHFVDIKRRILPQCSLLILECNSQLIVNKMYSTTRSTTLYHYYSTCRKPGICQFSELYIVSQWGDCPRFRFRGVCQPYITYLSLSFQHRERESSAARTVGIVMGIFVVCWTPFFIWMPLTALFELHTPPVIYR